jgi:hypothetical protein
MQTVAKSQSSNTAVRQVSQRPLTPTGQWRRANKGGILIVKDRRAVNK